MTGLELAPSADSAAADPNWQAVLERNNRFDGALFYAVRSTGIYCRPSCPSRRPQRRHVDFFFNKDAAEQAGFRPCRRCHPDRNHKEGREVELVRRVCQYVEENLDATLSQKVLQSALEISAHHLQRTFKRVVGVSIREYVDARRFALFKTALRYGQTVAEATYQAGYSSSSRVYEDVSSRMGMTPARYRSGGEGLHISFAVFASHLGQVLVAATEKGVCKISLGDSESELLSALYGEFPKAELKPDASALKHWMEPILAYLDGKTRDLDLPLDIRTTAFQQQVYEQLRRIPCGETRSYNQIAQALKMPKANRAVARACASNPVALTIPCHRVVRADGGLGGYRWGIERKKSLLASESDRARGK